MKKRETIYSLLNRISRKTEIGANANVVIIGCQTNGILYDGNLWNVPFSRCSDYVKSYILADNQLRIVSTSDPYKDE